MAERYVPEFFVGRRVLLDKIVDWANNPDPEHRVWSIVGPPGVGKSYLLNKARERLATDRVVLWIDLSRDLNIRGNEPDLVTDAGMAAWLKAAVDTAQQQCGPVRVYDDSVPFEAMLDSLAADLCEMCGHLPGPILLVDGFEEVTGKQRYGLEERVLACFISRGCTRILIGRRDENTLRAPALRWKERIAWLHVMDEAEADLQLSTRVATWARRPRRAHSGLFPLPPNILELLQLDDAAPPYSWAHPGINTYLLERAVLHWRASQQPLLTKQDLSDCILDITAIADARLSMHEFELLADLADLADGTKPLDEWLEGDLTRQLKITIEDDRLAELFRRGIILNVERTPRYKVADGLREALRAWRRL